MQIKWHLLAVGILTSLDIVCKLEIHIDAPRQLPVADCSSCAQVVAVTLQLLQKLVLSCELAGEALVPYYRQLLPIFNLYINSNKNLGDRIDYGQFHSVCLGEQVLKTLALFEARGGPDSFINIKYMIPTYESAILN